MPGESVLIEVILDVGRLEERAVLTAWAADQNIDLEQLENSGCGCCVDIYQIRTTREAADNLDKALHQVGTGISYL